MRGVFGDYQHERLHDGLLMIARIHFQLAFGFLVDAKAVNQLDMIQLIIRVLLRSEIFFREYDRDFHIAFIIQRMCQTVFIDDILERNGFRSFLHLWRGCHFYTENRLQLIDDLETLIGMIVMAFIHEDAQVRERLQVFKVRLTQNLI